MPTATKGRVAPVPLLLRCTARSAVGTSCGCSCARSTARQVAGLIRRTCAVADGACHLRAGYTVGYMLVLLLQGDCDDALKMPLTVLIGARNRTQVTGVALRLMLSSK